MSNESLERLAELTQQLFPQSDEYGIEKPTLGVDEKLARAADLIVEAQVALAIYGTTSDEQYKEIIESSDDAIVSKSLDSIVQSWNPAAERIFGYTAQEMIGRHISILFPPERLDEERVILDRIRRGERVNHFHTVRVCKDGSRILVSVTISPVKDSSGQIVGASKVARVVTELIGIDEQEAAALVLSEAKVVAEQMVADAKAAADLLLAKAKKAAEAVLLLAKREKDSRRF